MSPAVINLAQNPNPTVRVTYYIQNLGSSQTTINALQYVLPKGWVYAGNLARVNIVDNHDNPYDLADMVPTQTNCSNGACWSYTGPDPYNSCANKTVSQTASYQRLTWDWSSMGGGHQPRVASGLIAQISFDIQVSSYPEPGIYYDSPWTDIQQQQCGNTLQAGGPSSITVLLSVQLETESEDDSQETTMRVRLSNLTSIELYDTSR
jgi:hypothetical protein